MNQENREAQITCGVTGYNGYVGSAIYREIALSPELKAVPLGRAKAESPKPIEFSLGKDVCEKALEEIDVLVHCAYDFRVRRWRDIEKVNVQGSLKLFRAFKRAGGRRIIFISSMVSSENAQSMYGKAKYLVEQEVLRMGGIVVRPGLVYGRASQGIVGGMEKVVSLSPVIPLIGNGSFPQFMLHDEDLANAIKELVSKEEEKEFPQLITLAHPTPVSFKEILCKLSEDIRGRHPWFIPLPVSLLRIGLSSVEYLGLRPRMRSDSLVGLVTMNSKQEITDSNILSLTMRDFIKA